MTSTLHPDDELAATAPAVAATGISPRTETISALLIVWPRGVAGPAGESREQPQKDSPDQHVRFLVRVQERQPQKTRGPRNNSAPIPSPLSFGVASRRPLLKPIARTRGTKTTTGPSPPEDSSDSVASSNSLMPLLGVSRAGDRLSIAPSARQGTERHASLAGESCHAGPLARRCQLANIPTREQRYSRPRRYATVTASVRLDASSLAITRDRCTLTVFSLM